LLFGADDVIGTTGPCPPMSRGSGELWMSRSIRRTLSLSSLISYRSISGEHPDWDDYRTAMIKQRRCLIRITATKAGPTVFG
jgi:hypothetical protein